MLYVLWFIAAAYAITCVIWALMVSELKGKIVIISIIVLFVILTFCLPDYRQWINIGGLIFGIGCFFYAKLYG